MANLHCSFKAGKILVEEPRRITARKQVRLLGNGWRGVLVLACAILWIYGLWELGLIALSLACLWSIADNLLRNWKKIYTRQKVLLYLRQGRTEEALAICGEPEPHGIIWWRYLIFLFRQQRWTEAARYLEEMEEGKERDYLLAVTYLGQNLPDAALSLCPTRLDGQWRILKAEAFFQMQEWHKVLGVLRGSRAKDSKVNSLELAWLKGGSYYFLHQYKPAVKLLRMVAEQSDSNYAGSGEWLKLALAKLE